MPDRSQRNRLLILALNGGGAGMWGEAQKALPMPALHALMQRGISGSLGTYLPTLDAPNWASFYTGVNPAKHHVQAFTRLRPSGRPGPMPHQVGLPLPTFASQLAQAGRRLISVFAPFIAPQGLANGVIVRDRPSSDGGPLTHPAGLQPQLERELGLLHPPHSMQSFPAQGLPDAGAVNAFLASQEQSLRHTHDIAAYLMTRFDWDVSLVHLYAMDTVQHALWHYLDPSHPGFRQDPVVEASLGRLSAVADDVVQNLVNLAQPAAVLVFSTHTFGPCVKVLNIERFLAERAARSAFGNGGLMRRLMRRSSGENMSFMSEHKVIYVHSAKVNEADRQRLTAELEDLRDPDSGAAVVNKVWTGVDLYGSANSDAVYQTWILDLARGYSARSGAPESPLLWSMTPGKDYLSGTHRQNGFWIWSDPALGASQVQPARIIDLAPTILSYLGLAPQEPMEGTALLRQFVTPQVSQGSY